MNSLHWSDADSKFRYCSGHQMIFEHKNKFLKEMKTRCQALSFSYTHHAMHATYSIKNPNDITLEHFDVAKSERSHDWLHVVIFGYIGIANHGVRDVFVVPYKRDIISRKVWRKWALAMMDIRADWQKQFSLLTPSALAMRFDDHILQAHNNKVLMNTFSWRYVRCWCWTASWVTPIPYDSDLIQLKKYMRLAKC